VENHSGHLAGLCARLQLRLIRKAPRSKRTTPPSRGWGNRLRAAGAAVLFLAPRAAGKSIEQNADIDWVIVRPAMLTNGLARGNYRHGFNVGNYMWPRRISRADVADFMLEQLNDDTYIGTAPGVCY
jgi:hypothetical protein